MSATIVNKDGSFYARGVDLTKNISLPKAGPEDLVYAETYMYYDQIVSFIMLDPNDSSVWFMNLFDEHEFLGNEFFALHFGAEFYNECLKNKPKLSDLYLNESSNPGIKDLYQCYVMHDETDTSSVWLCQSVTPSVFDGRYLPSANF